jgi:hypothetical protein
MAKLTIVFGLLLILLGLFSFVATGHQHPTALIPLYFGAVLAGLGVGANSPDLKRRMLMMHVAVTVALLGFLGTISGVVDFIRMEQGKQFAYPAAPEAKTVMCILCLVFVLLCVRSFIAARRARV